MAKRIFRIRGGASPRSREDSLASLGHAEAIELGSIIEKNVTKSVL